MSGLLDTSVIVRYLTGEPDGLAAMSARIIEQDDDLTITEVALVESAWVLERYYRAPRSVIVDALVRLVSRANLRTAQLPKPFVIQALMLCRPSRRVGFADAVLWSSARAAGEETVYTFDRRFPAEGISRRREPA